MKFTRYFLCALCAGFTHTAGAQSSPVMLRVKATAGDSHDRIKNSSASVHHQKKELTASLTNMSREEQKDLTVKWYAFGRDENSKSVVLISSVSNSVILAPAKTGTDTFSAATTYTPDHFVSTNSRSRSSGKTRTSVKKVAGSGAKMLGWGVQIIREGKVLAEEFQPPNLKTSVSTAGQPASAAKKKK